MGDPKASAHAVRIRDMIREMRTCLAASEVARDQYYERRNAYAKERGLKGVVLDKAVAADYPAQGAISDSQLYDRWTTKYAAVVSAEIEAYKLGLHP